MGDNPAGGSSEIWRLEAEGRVTIRTATDTARGDRAVYDMDQAVLVLTGRELSLTTPTQLLTSRDSLEYWSQRRMAVARGNAVAVDNQEGRRISADTLVSYLLAEDAPAAAATPAAPVRPATANATPTATGRAAAPAPGAGKVDRVEAFGHVEIRTPTEVVRGDRGVYSPATGMARLLGNVRITRGDNQVNGREAIVNLRTGVARLVSASDRGERVRGLIVPQQDKPGTPQAPSPSPSSSPQAATPQANSPQQGRRP
jgi:lipopolysaccharide export system protein LptA